MEVEPGVTSETELPPWTGLHHSALRFTGSTLSPDLPPARI